MLWGATTPGNFGRSIPLAPELGRKVTNVRMEQDVVEGGILTGEKIKIKSKDSEESHSVQQAKRRHSVGKKTWLLTCRNAQ